MYLALSTLRRELNAVPHFEPTGDEVFDSALPAKENPQTY
jgi:hypothetical protein